MSQVPRSLLESIEQDQQTSDRDAATHVGSAMTALVKADVPGHIATELALAGVSRSDADTFERKALVLATSKEFLEAASRTASSREPRTLFGICCASCLTAESRRCAVPQARPGV